MEEVSYDNIGAYYPKTSVLAIIALIFAVIVPIIGLVLSIIALVRINKNSQLKGKGLVITALVISIFFCITSFLFFIGV